MEWGGWREPVEEKTVKLLTHMVRRDQLIYNLVFCSKSKQTIDHFTTVFVYRNAAD